MTKLVNFTPIQVGTFLAGWDIGLSDDVKVRIRNGTLSAVVKRADGRIQTGTTMLGGKFQRATNYDKAASSPLERRKIVKLLRKEGHRQTAIAELLGVSQATVSLDLKT